MTQLQAEEEKLLLSSLMANSGFYIHDTSTAADQAAAAQVVKSVSRRRRRRPKGDVESRKRRLTDEQVRFLEMNFDEERKLESKRKVHLAAELGLDPKQVAVWFQNRRARFKNKQLEDEFTRLKSAHGQAVVDKCHLENEVLRLKEKLSEAEEEIRKLSGGGGSDASTAARGGTSPCSSFSTETHHHQQQQQQQQQQTFLGEYGVGGVLAPADVYMEEYNYNNYCMMMDLINSYGML